MNYKLVVINTLLLLYWEQQLDTGADNSTLIKSIVKELRPQRDAIDTDDTKAMFNGLLVMIAKQLNHYNEKMMKEYLIQQVKVICKSDPDTLDIILDGLNQELDQKAIRTYCITLQRELKTYQRTAEFTKALGDVAKRVLYSNESFDLPTMSRSIVSEFEKFAEVEGEDLRSIRGVSDFVDFDDIESLKRLFFEAKKSVSPDEIVKFGIQALNRMFGEQGGARRGEQCMIGGLQHHFKSGMAMMMTRGAAMYNVPKPKDPNKKPAILMISTENQLTVNLRTMYKQALEPVIRKKIRVADIDPAAAASYMKEKFMENGWHFLMAQVDPEYFGYDELQALVLKCEAMGYEIILMTVDYLGMCSTKGLTHSGITGRDKQALFNRSRNLMLRHNYIMITPHQLSTEALAIHRDRPKSFMNEVLNRAYYHDCKTLAQEVDWECNLQKLEDGNDTYLMVGRGKHRGVDDTPMKDQRFCLKFGEFGIEDDINGEDLSMKSPGGGTASGSGGTPWWEQSEAATLN